MFKEYTEDMGRFSLWLVWLSCPPLADVLPTAAYHPTLGAGLPPGMRLKHSLTTQRPWLSLNAKQENLNKKVIFLLLI